MLRELLSPPALPDSLSSRESGDCISATRLSVESGWFTIVLRVHVSGQRAFLHPVHVKQALRKQPCAISFHELVEVTERGEHQASLSAVNRDVMSQAIGFPGGAV